LKEDEHAWTEIDGKSRCRTTGFAEAAAGAAGERAAEIGAAFFGEGRETLNDLVVAVATSVFLPGLRASSKSAGAGRETVS